MIKRRKRTIFKSRSGTTMVEVLVAFVVLILIMGIFSQAMSLAGRMLGQSDHRLEDSRELAGGYYLDDTETADISAPQEKTMAFQRTSGGSEGFSVQVKLKTYTKKDGGGKLVEIVRETTEAASE